MCKFNSKSLVVALAASGLVSFGGVAVAAGSVSSTLTVSANLVSACEVSPTASISFGNINNLQTTGPVTADSGTTFKIACSSDVAAPMISSISTRTMGNGVDTVPFNLSLTAGAVADDFPLTATGLVIVQDGALKTVPLFAKVAAASYFGKSGGAYTVPLTIVIGY